jgi:hypothetical protein
MQHDPTDLTANEEARRERARQLRTERYLASEDIKWLMGTKRGRRIVWRLLERTGVYRSSFTGDNETFFREGERNVGLMLMAQINESCPESYTLMMKEKHERPSDDSDSST